MTTSPQLPPLCRGNHTVAKVEVTPITYPDGRADRIVTVERSRCGHTYFWGGVKGTPLPTPGQRAPQCLGPQVGAFGDVIRPPSAEAVFDERVRPTKRRRLRKDEDAA